MEHLTGGVVLFKDVVDVPPNIITELEQCVDISYRDMYEFTYDENGELLYGVNRSGHTILKEHMAREPIRMNENNVLTVDSQFFGNCDKAIYNSLLEYFTLFPHALPCVWWEVGGHVAYYPTGSAYGLHSDNDVDYVYGHVPPDQSALNQVLSISLGLNDGYKGGHLRFEYLDIDIQLGIGDALFFPSNFMATHEVTEVTDGCRYAYLTNYGQGSPAHDRNVFVHDERKPGKQGKSWLPSLEPLRNR